MSDAAKQDSESVVLDIETENTEGDVLNGNKRIISVQMGDSLNQELYYADATVPTRSLLQAKARINSIVRDGGVVAGYNLREFDIPILRRFLEVTIPDASVLDLKDTEGVSDLTRRLGRKRLRLEDVCSEYGISTVHKSLMDRRAEQFKSDPQILVRADAFAQSLVTSKGWDFQFSRGYALDKIAFGHAILDSYQEFVSKSGSKDTLFHTYATGDVVCEYKLMQALTC